MPWTNEHLDWLHDTGEVVAISSGENVPVYKFAYDIANEEVMNTTYSVSLFCVLH